MIGKILKKMTTFGCSYVFIFFMNILKPLTVIFVIFQFLQICFGQPPNIKFVRYKEKNGLIHDEILSICQDKYGFMWFGTKYGCSKFDGVEFKSFQYSKTDTCSIGDGLVNKIVNDINGDLWFAITGKNKTFLKYDYENECFNDYSKHFKEKLHLTQSELRFWKLHARNNGKLWICLEDYGMSFDVSDNSITEFDKNKIHFDGKALLEDSGGNIWLSSSKGVFVYNNQLEEIANFKHIIEDPGSISSNKCFCMFKDADSTIWIGTNRGLNKFIPGNNINPVEKFSNATFERFIHEPGNDLSLSSNMIYDISSLDSTYLIIATVNGLNLLNRTNGTIYRFYNDELDEESINSDIIRCIYTDKYNNLWLGTSSGIGKLKINNFKTFEKSIYQNSLSHNKVQFLYQSNNNSIWIATPKGIDVFDPLTEEFKFISGISKRKNGLHGAPIVFHPKGDKGLWIGTWGGGINYYSYNSKQIQDDEICAKFSHVNTVFSLFRDSKGYLWLDNSGKGIYAYNLGSKSTKLFTHNSNDTTSLLSNQVSYVFEDSRNRVWIGTLKGLCGLINIGNGVFSRYLEGVGINYIAEDFENNIWLGTYRGLFKINTQSNTISHYNISNGLPGNIVNALVFDNDKNLWLSTNKGLAKWPYPYDRLKLRTIRLEEGVSSGEYLPGSCAKLNDGSILFGGTNGFCRFHPNMIKKDTIAPEIIITGLKILGQQIKPHQKINNQIILTKSILCTDHITLNHKNNAFTIEFVGLQYNLPQYSTYAYMLKGYDQPKGWHYTGMNGREAKYMKLPGGEYTFIVKAANCDGIWSHQNAAINISILPPWWQTIWFYIVCAIITIMLIILTTKIRTLNLQKQKGKLENIVEQRTTELKEMNEILVERKEELEQQMDELAEMNIELKTKTIQVSEMAKQIHEADQSKLRLFANVSHEFRTPLSLIIAPLKQCLNLQQPIIWENVNISNYLRIMNKNASRLLKLINQIIDIRKIEQGGKKLNRTQNNIIEFIHDAIDVFSVTAAAKHLSLNIEHSTFFNNHLTFNKNQPQPDKLVETKKTLINEDQMINVKCKMLNDFWFDPDIMEKILYNLISNAIKYTPEGGEISIAVGVAVETRHALSLQNNQLAIKISDTGIGISPENIDKIFDRFYRVETHGHASLQNNRASQPDGTGIGLAYTKELVELHNGTVHVESTPDQGSLFTVTFPIEEKLKDNQQFKSEVREKAFGYTQQMVNSEHQIEATEGAAPRVDYKEKTSKPTRNSTSILLVEDNFELREFVKSELESEYIVFEAENGQIAWDLAIKNIPGIIISDIMMPVMEGTELCRKIKAYETTSHIPVILLTAKSGEENIMKGLDAGADDYISKPFNIHILLKKISNILSYQQRLHERFRKSVDIPVAEITKNSIDEKFIQKAIAIVQENMSEPDFDNTKFIQLLCSSKSVVYLKIKTITGQSVSEFIRNIRLKAAAQIFLQGDTNISEVSFQVGFKHPANFTKYFTQTFGKSPRQFIKDGF